MDKKQKGFTLIEMILVTVIIGILAGVVITVIDIPRTQARSRDSKRIGDLKRIQTALELYFADNRAYPRVTSFGLAQAVLAGSIVPNYMDQIPLDPLNNKTVKDTSAMRCREGSTSTLHGYYYKTDANGTKYVMSAIMELAISPENINNRCDNISNCKTGGGVVCGPYAGNNYCYCVQNPM